MPAGAEEGLAGRPHRRDRRRVAGQAPRLEGRRHHPAAGDHLSEEGQQQLAVHPARHLQGRRPQAEGPGKRAVLPLEVLRRGQRLRQGPRRLVRGGSPTAAPPPTAWRWRSTSSARTPTTRPRPRPRHAFNQAFAKQFADIGLIVTAIMGAVFFTLLLLTGNTMAQAVRERIPELAVLKTIGFSNRSVLWLVLARVDPAGGAGRADRPGHRRADHADQSAPPAAA